ncbi:MAG: universal stress protein [Actinomycetota bacterium]
MDKIIVGIDGSKPSARALDWAIDHADDDDTIVVVHAWSIPAAVGLELPVASLAAIESGANQLVSDPLPGADVPDDGPTFDSHVATGHAGALLSDLSAGADLVVVGCRGYGGIRSALLGSVSNYVVHHARCPVVVVREDADDG